MISIVFKQVGKKYRAIIETKTINQIRFKKNGIPDDEFLNAENFGEGDTSNEAVGDLVNKNQSKFKVTISNKC